MDDVKVYLASAHQNKFFCETLKNFLTQNFGSQFFNAVKIVSSWHSSNSVSSSNKERSEIDLSEIESSDIVLMIFPYGREGSICELSYAFGIGKLCVYVRPDTFSNYDPLITGRFSDNVYSGTGNGFIARDTDEIVLLIHRYIRSLETGNDLFYIG